MLLKGNVEGNSVHALYTAKQADINGYQKVENGNGIIGKIDP